MMFRFSTLALVFSLFIAFSPVTIAVQAVTGAPDEYEQGWGSAASRQVIVLDAGSTGVRAVEYCFGADRAGSSYELVSQSKIFNEGRPLTIDQGLSEKALETIGAMSRMPHCKGTIEKQYFFMGGTAGLRTKLKMAKVRNQLELTSSELRSRGLDAKYGDNVRLLSGLEEAAFTWLAVNYIKDRMFWWSEHYGVIELGGGSVQKATEFRRKPGTRNLFDSTH